MADTSAPTREKGHGGTSIVPWSGLVDSIETTPELQWPLSIQVYDLMRRTESQLAGVLRAITMPIRNFDWFIDPNGADPKKVAVVAEDMGLSVLGDDPNKPKPRSKGRFSFDRHLRHALLSGVFGHMFFEQYGEIVDGLWRLRKLAPRMPGTISEIKVERDGGLQSIVQFGSGRPGEPISDPIPVTQLLAYVNDQEGGNWFGQSWLRAAYRHWLIKDRLLRVDAIKHERQGMGMPIAEAMANATRAQIEALDAMMQKWKVGEAAGGAVPAGTRVRLVGTEGSTPDTIGSVRYHDEQMSKLMLVQFLDLGTSGAGNRALGEAFVDFFDLSLQSTAKWLADVTTEHQVEDQWDWNWGENDQAARIGFKKKEADPEASVQELRDLVDGELLVVDDEVRDWIREKKGIPARPPQAAEEDPSSQIYKYDLDYGIVTLNERRAQLGLPPVDGGDELLTPVNDPAADPPSGTDAFAKMSRMVRAARQARRPFGKPGRVVSATLELPSGRTTRRGLYDHEVQAATDFPALEQQFTAAQTDVVAEWKKVQTKQIAELTDAIKNAETLDDLANLTATPGGGDMLAEFLAEQADEAAELALTEAKAQGVTILKPDLTDAAELLADRAAATETLMAKSLSETAGRQAIQRAAGGAMTMTEVSQQVQVHLMGLSDAYLEEQLGGALQQAVNTGRRAIIDAGDATEIYASELLDTNTCETCMEKDGEQYDTLAAAESDYPTGGYLDCLGGPRCRGTLVAVYSEAEASE